MREPQVVQALVDMADTLVDDYDVVDVLTRLADRCVELLGVTAAGVMLGAPGGDLQLIASSSEEMRLVELFELQADEGPCLDCFSTGERVSHEDLEAPDGPWPRFAEVATAAGFVSALALPLRLRGVTAGALNLFSVDRSPMSEADIVVAQAFADLATISVLQSRAHREAQVLNEQLNTALTNRVVIEQAKGVIAERMGLEVEQAFTVLRRHARNNNLLLTDVARSAIDGSLDTSTLSVPPKTAPA